jgi:hypothetical protein
MASKKDIRTNKYLNGILPENCQFQTRQEMIEAMQDKRYATDEEYRDLVTHMLQRPFADEESRQATQSGPVDGRTLARAMSDPAAARKQELALVARERYQAMFTKRDENGNLLYDKSPSYREEVRQILIANSDAIDAQMPAGALVNRDLPQHRQAFRVVIGENSSLYDEIKQAQRDKQAAQDKADLAERHARLDRGEDADRTALDGQKV